jgi:hypothetical protein
MPTGHYKFRGSFGVVTRLFRGARYGDPFDPKGPQYFTEGRVLDYSTDVGPFTIVDQSDEGNTATLYSGRGATIGPAANTITYPTGYGSAERTATVWMRVDVLGARTLNGATGTFTFTPTATGIWEQLSSTATVSGNLSWTPGSDCDIGDLTCATEHWTHDDFSNPTGDTSNGKTIVDSGPNDAHGTCTGCAGFTGEATIPQTADRNWNKYHYCEAVDKGATLSSEIILATSSEWRVEWTSSAGSFAQDSTIFGNGVGKKIAINLTGNSLEIRGDVTGQITFDTLQTEGQQYSFAMWQSAGVIYLSVDGVTQSATFTQIENLYIKDFGYQAGRSNEALNGFVYNIYINATANNDIWTNSYSGLGNDPYQDLTGSNNGTLTNSPKLQLVSASDEDDQIDAYGTAILEPRTNAQVVNIFGDGELVKTPAAASLDTIKTVSGWIWHDGTARTVIDLGTPTVGTTATDLTSSGFTGVTYFVNGPSGTTLSAGWNHCVVASTAALATDDIDILAKSGSSIDYITTLTVTEALQNFDAQKALYNTPQ